MNTETVSITDSISISLPGDFKILKHNINYNILEAKYREDIIVVFKAPTDLPDSLRLVLKKQAFINNVNGFIRPFNYQNLDSTFKYNNNCMQSDLKFEFVSQEKPKVMFARILVKNKDFVVISYQMADPNNKQLLRTKDKLFASIKIK